MKYQYYDKYRDCVVRTGYFWLPSEGGPRSCGPSDCYECKVTDLGIFYQPKLTKEQTDDVVETPQGVYYRYWESWYFYPCATTPYEDEGE